MLTVYLSNPPNKTALEHSQIITSKNSAMPAGGLHQEGFPGRRAVGMVQGPHIAALH